MKRFIALLLSAVMMLSGIPVFAAEEAEFYIAETFDNYVTNGYPELGNYTAEVTRVVECGEMDKEMYLYSKKKTITAQYDVVYGQPGLTISFDITFTENRPSGTLTVMQGNTAINVLTLDNFGLKLLDGKNIGGIPVGMKTNVKLTMTANKITADIGGKRSVGDWYIEKGLPQSYTSLKFELTPSENGSGVALDNVYAYSGEASEGAYPRKTYNPEATELQEESGEESTEEIIVGNTVMFDKDFEAEATRKTGFILFSPKSNTMDFYQDKRTGNWYLEYTRTGTEDGLFEASFGTQLSDRRYFVMDCDIRITNDNPTTSFTMYSNEGQQNPVKIASGGALTSNGVSIGRLNLNEWTHIAVCMDYAKKVNHIYINGELVAEGIDFENPDCEYLKSFRSYFSSRGTGSVAYDNIRFYEGKEPKENIYEVADEVASSEASSLEVPEKIRYVERAQESLAGYTAISYYANTYYANGKKGSFKNAAYMKDGRVYVSGTEAAELLGYKIDWNADIGRVIINDNIKWMNGDTSIDVNGTPVTEPGIPEIKDGEIYIPVRFLAENVLGKVVTWDPKQLVIIGNNKFNDYVVKIGSYSRNQQFDTALWEISDMLNYEILTKENIKKNFDATLNNAHPRLLINADDIQHMKDSYASNEMFREGADEIIKKADKLVADNSPTVPSPSVQGNWLGTARQILERLQQLGIAWYLKGDNTYAEMAWAELQSIGSLPSWDRKHWLDLGEFQAAFAIGYDWFYDYWTEEQKTFIYNATRTKAFDIQVKAYTSGADAGELASYNNRSIVFSTGTAMTAMAFYEIDPNYFADIIWRTARNLNIVSRMWYPDGGWMEGTAYWEYTCQYTIYFLESFINCFGSDARLTRALGFNNAPKLLKTVATSTGGFNYGDVGDASARPSQYMSWFARYFDDEETMQYRIWGKKYYGNSWGLFDTYYGIFDIDFDYSPYYPLDTYLRNVEIVTMREKFLREGTSVSFKGGYGTTPHGHWDIGTFVIDMGGVRIATDYGSESYGAGSEGANQYRKRTEGHNCLVFNPGLEIGQTATSTDFSPVTDFVSKERGAYAVLDMTAAYEKYVTSSKRGFMLANDRRSVIIRDEFTLKSKVPTYWIMQTPANVELLDNKTAILTRGTQKIKMEFISSSRDAKFITSAAEKFPSSPKSNTQETVNKDYTKLMIQFDGMGKEYIEVRFIKLDDPAVESDMPDTPIENWYIADGAVEDMPTLSGISVGGVPVEGFDPTTQSYTVEIPDTLEKLPEITATADKGNITVTYAEDEKGFSTIKVATSEYVFRNYYIAYKMIASKPDMNTLEEIPVKKFKASAEPQGANPIKGAFDRNLDTRWSAQETCWIEADLGGTFDVSRVGILIHEGSKREQLFSIEVSTDGINYTQVYNNRSSGKTDDTEYYNVKGAKARFVRVTCYGTSVGNWNSIKEIYVYKNK